MAKWHSKKIDVQKDNQEQDKYQDFTESNAKVGIHFY